MTDIPLLSPSSLLAPPTLPAETQLLSWVPLPNSDLVTDHIAMVIWDHEISPASWRVARLSPAVYVYHEKRTNWRIVAKFSTPKTGKNAVHHAEREFQRTQRAWQCTVSDLELRSVQPLGLWNGVLFLEHVDGLTLENEIAVRRSRPGELLHVLETTGNLLVKLHTKCIQRNSLPDFGPTADYAYKLVDNLARHGVLKKHPNVRAGLGRLIEEWAEDILMWNFDQTLIHGDASTTNFIFPPSGGVVSIDWESSEFADPAADLGCLMAEVSHSVNQYGGDFAEGLAYANELASAYCNALTSFSNLDSLVHRAKFYQAVSTLRIACNGWLSHHDRLALILQAFVLFSR